MAKYLIIIISLILLAGLLLPQAVNAALVPCGRHEDDLTTPEKETDPCNLCHIFMMLQRLLNGIGLVAAGWAIIFIVIGGIVIMTAGGSPDKASQGKRMITYAIIGIVIAFGAWLVINTLMNKLVRPEAMPWPWNKIKCVPTEPIEENGEEEEEGEYCVCEVPVYDLDPSKYPAQAKRVATNVKTTKLASKEDCEQKCNSNSYCSIRQSGIKPSDHKFSCRTEEYVKNTSALGLKHPDFMSNDFCILGCFQTESECADSANIENPNFESCGRKCFWLGKDYCACRSVGTAGCPEGKGWALTRTRKEGICDGNKNTLWDCVTSDECYCRLGGSPRFGESCDKCSPTPVSLWCKRSAPAGSENWPIAGIKSEQKGDASIDLTNFLNCFYSKTEVRNYPIVSISDDHLCNETCTMQGNTCSSACQHSCTSGHYGCGANSSCYGMSLAVDIDIEDGNRNQEAAINKAAEECRIALGWGVIRCLGPSNTTSHYNHVHVGIAPAFSECNCDNIQNVNQACLLDLLGTDTHYECDGGGFCREVAGPGANSCTLIGQYDPACTHKECVGYTCDEVPNTGQVDEPNQCVSNSDCD